MAGGRASRLTPEEAFARLPERLAEIGVQVTQHQLTQFRAHFDLLLRWSQKINLTAIREPEEIIRRHFVESAFVTQVVKFGAGTLVDVGSGAGFPGLPIKILSPETRVVLVESVQKKAAFLKEVGRAIQSDPALEVMACRLSDLALKADWVTARAVRQDSRLIREMRAVLVPRGTMVLVLAAGKAAALGEGWRVEGIGGGSAVATSST